MVAQLWKQCLIIGCLVEDPVFNSHMPVPLMTWFPSSRIQDGKRYIIKCDESSVIKTKDKAAYSFYWSWEELQRDSIMGYEG